MPYKEYTAKDLKNGLETADDDMPIRCVIQGSTLTHNLTGIAKLDNEVVLVWGSSSKIASNINDIIKRQNSRWKL